MVPNDIINILRNIISDEDWLILCNGYGINSAEIKITENNNSDILSVYQKIVLLTSVYVYFAVNNNLAENKENFDKLIDEFNTSEQIYDNLESVFTKERINYIKQDFIDNSKSTVDLFINIPDYLTDIFTAITQAPIKEKKIKLSNLSSKEYEHIKDREILEKLRSIKSLEKIGEIYIKYGFEKIINICEMGSDIEVTKDNIPYLYNALLEVCSILNVDKIPKLYMKQGFINACTSGAENPIIIVDSSVMSLLDYDELLFLLGHEVGHIKCQHMLYRTIGDLAHIIGDEIGNLTLGVGNLINTVASSGGTLLLAQWDRATEFSADRAGLLACQNVNAAYSVLMKLAGYPPKYYNSIDVDTFIAQAESFENLDEENYNKIMKFYINMYNDHPWNVLRAKELKNWVDSGQYEKVIKRDVSVIKPSNQYEITLAMSNEVKCKNCGWINNDGSKFCKKCGTKF